MDASVVVQVGDVKAETKSMPSQEPVWDEDVQVPIEDSEKFIEISVLHNGMVGRTVLGRIRMSIVEVGTNPDSGSFESRLGVF